MTVEFVPRSPTQQLMTNNSSSDVNSIGYLSTKVLDSQEYVGGLLIVDLHARPLEFHCTAPVRPKRAQAILYGATLKSHLLHQLIPASLLAKAGHRPEIVFVDQLEFIQRADEAEVPLVYLKSSSGAGSAKSTDGSVAPQPGFGEETSDNPLVIDRFRFVDRPQYSFAFHVDRKVEQRDIENTLDAISHCVSVHEPFERLEIALRESNRASSNAA